MMPGELSMESIKERLDWLEARVTESEGDSTLTGIYWDELRHLRQVYDRMVMDSQGKGIQMMQDIMVKEPETRDNYTVGVPVADSQSAPGIPSAVPAAPAAVVPHAEPDGDEGPTVNLTINVNGEKSMDIMRSQGDVRIPLNMQAPLEKARRARGEKEASVDGIDQDKIDASKKKGKPEEEKEPDTETEKSHRRIETSTLQKSMLMRRAKGTTIQSAVGAWAFKALKKSQSVDDVAHAIQDTIRKSGGAIVMGVKAPASAEAKKSAYAEIVALNCEIQRLQEQIQNSNEPDVNVALDAKLRAVYEKLAAAVMRSEGMGLTTEDLVVSKPDTRFPEKMTEGSVGKSQKDDITKAKPKSLAKEPEVLLVVGDAPIDKKLCKSAKGKHAHEHKPEGLRAGFGETNIKHVVRHPGKK